MPNSSTARIYFKYAQQVGNLNAPKEYCNQYSEKTETPAKPVGVDPVTGNSIYWGQGHEVACNVNEKPQD